MPNKSGSIPLQTIRVAAAQAEPVAGDLTANISKVVELIHKAADDHVKLVVFPEKFLSGYEPDLIKSDFQKYTIGKEDDRMNPITEICKRRNISAIVGSATNDEDGLHISSIVVNSEGKIVTQYHKQHLFSSEKSIFKEGRKGCILELDGWRLGLAICYDTGFPEHARLLAVNGCHAYLASALFSVGNGYHESRIWFPARALDNTIYVLLSNHFGTTGGWNACGSSAVWDPYGKLIAEGSSDSQSLVIADFDPAVLDDIRKRETMLEDIGSGYHKNSDEIPIFNLI